MDASKSTTNYGTSAALRVDGSPVVRSYLTFDVTGVSGAVTSATLRIYANSNQSVGFDVYPVADTSWGETTITDANAPPFGSTVLGSSGKVTANSWTSVDVTSAVNGNGLVSFGLSTANSTALSLSSRTGANPPQLVIGWSGGGSLATPTPTPTPTPSPTPTATPSPTPTATPSPTPTATPSPTPTATPSPTPTATSDPDSDADSDPHADAHADADPHADTDADPDSDPDPDSDADIVARERHTDTRRRQLRGRLEIHD